MKAPGAARRTRWREARRTRRPASLPPDAGVRSPNGGGGRAERKNRGGRSPGPPSELWPDHLAEDFLLSYHLYLSAYFRMLEENFLPAVLICEDLDAYQPSTMRILSVLLKDFANRLSFLPVFTSGAKEPPEALAALNPVRLSVRPLRLAEMGRLASEHFPGLRLAGKDWQLIRLAVRGKPVTFQHCLQYLQRKGLIRKEGEQYRWQAAEGWEVILPKRPLALSWQVVAQLGPEPQRVLFVAYLTQGLLDLQGVTAFLGTLGVPEAPGYPDRGGTGGPEPGARFPPPGARVPRLPPAPAAARVGRGARAGGTSARAPDRAVAARGLPASGSAVLPAGQEPARRHRVRGPARIAETEARRAGFRGGASFLEPKNFRLDVGLSSAVQKNLAMQLGAVRIRYSLLVGNRKEAEAAYLKAVDQGSDFQVSPVKGELFLQIGRYLVSRGETNIALQWVKKALIQFQGSSSAVEEREATLEVGAVMLAEARVSEAQEYFNLAGPPPDPGPGRSCAWRPAGLRAVHPGQPVARPDRGPGRTGQGARAEAPRVGAVPGLPGGPPAVRAGLVRGGVRAFQEALAVEALYPDPAARGVLYAWLARAFAFAGQPPEPSAFAPRLAQSRIGTVPVQAEACFLAARVLPRRWSTAARRCP